MDRAAVLRKIQACLNRAKSSNPNEAAIALRQAQAMMEKYGVDHPELLSVGVERHWARSRAKERPPQYEVFLASTVGRMFGCDIVFTNETRGMNWAGGYTFIGTGASAEIASYTYAVLSRQLTAARKQYSDVHLKRYRKNKVAAADAFCGGWVAAVAEKAPIPALTDDRRAAIDAYKAQQFSKTSELNSSKREMTGRQEPGAHLHLGYLEGSKAKVNTGLRGAGTQQSLLT